MTFGNYVLFNLLVAILVEGFSTEKMGNNFDIGKVKIMSILKKIAISNKNDSSLRVVENQLNKSSNSNNSSPYKSIIKIRSSQLQSLSSSTIQSFHTCIESMDK
ncbi:unnamed protein product [Rotaria sp. Silwood1]|nr:unnamed protein product [Rotaria sp. Silwood1]